VERPRNRRIGYQRRDFVARPITSVFLTLNGYEYGKTNIVPPPAAPPAGTAPPPPRKVEFQAQAPQQPSFATPPAPPHAGVPPFQYPPPLAPPKIPSFPPDQRQFAIHARIGWSSSSLGRLVVSTIKSLDRPHLHLHSNSPPPHLPHVYPPQHSVAITGRQIEISGPQMAG
jgi:hypothetical protein